MTTLKDAIGVIRTTHHETDPCARIIQAWAYGEVRVGDHQGAASV